MPPELIPGIGDDPRNANPFLADIWCLGETAFKMLTDQATLDNHLEVLDYWNGHLEFPSEPLEEVGVSETAIDFLQLLMAANPLQRLSTKQASQHNWMTRALPFVASNGPRNFVPRNVDLPLIPHLDLFTIAPFKMDEITQASGQWTRTMTVNVPV